MAAKKISITWACVEFATPSSWTIRLKHAA
jgi:hypothetical protein